MAVSGDAPNITGKRYEATIPDTLDLADRAKLALNGLGGVLDPERDHLMHFFVRYNTQPPYMYHWAYDYENVPKFAESFPLMRAMCGSDLYLEREHKMMSAMVDWLSPDDGLYYSIYRPDRPWHSLGHQGYEQAPEDFANVGIQGRMLRAMLAWRERDPRPEWDDRIRGIVSGLEKVAIDRGGYAYYPDGGFGTAFSYPRSGWRNTDEPLGEDEGGEGSVVAYHGHQLYGLAWWYEVSGDERAVTLARKLARFVMQPRFWGAEPEPLMVAGHEQGHFITHLHARCVALRGLLRYAVATNDQRAKEFVRFAYEFARTLGIPRLGWYACYGASNHFAYCEGCALGDMVALGIRLSDAGLGDYWDDVDGIARNHLIEGQLTDASLLEHVAEGGPSRPAGTPWRLTNRGFENIDVFPGQEVTENVIERSLGNYAGHSTPTSIPSPWVMQCCTGNGTQGLYYAWESIVRGQDGDAQVNLLLNRASSWLDVDSHLPYEGKVLLTNKTARRVSVRIPSWVDRNAIRCTVNGEDRTQAWIGSYLVVDALKPADLVRLEFPMVEETVTYTALSRMWRSEQKYACHFKGNTLVDISPRDDDRMSYPLYQRDHYKQTKAPLKSVTRFVADKESYLW